MTYSVVMIRFPSDGSVPAHELEEKFSTREEAVAAGNRELAAQSFAPDAGFQIRDANGELILSVPSAAATE